MSVKFYYYNLVNQEPTVTTATNENLSFPVSNLKDARSTKSFRSTTSSSVIVFDFITVEIVNSIIITANKINGYNITAPITIEANSTDTWAAPAFTTTITSLDDDFGYTLKEFTDQSYRFWRITLSSAIYVELGNIFIGAKMELGTRKRSVNFGWSYDNNDLSKGQTNRYGQSFFDENVSQISISGNLDNLNLAEIDNFFELFDFCGITKTFYFFIDCDGFINNKNRFLGHYRLTDRPSVMNKFFALYSTSIKIREVN